MKPIRVDEAREDATRPHHPVPPASSGLEPTSSGGSDDLTLEGAANDLLNGGLDDGQLWSKIHDSGIENIINNTY